MNNESFDGGLELEDDLKAAKGTKEQQQRQLQQPPDGFGARHLQIFLLFLGMVFAYALRVFFSVAIVAMIDGKNDTNFKHYDWDSSRQGLIKSAFFWGYTITNIPCGYIAGAWSAQKLLCLGIFISSLSNIVTPVLVDVGGWPTFCALRAIGGFTQACLMPSIQTLLARWVPPSERARLGAFTYAGAQLGTVITMPISGWLAASRLGWPSTFYLFGSLGIAWSILFFVFGSDQPNLHSSISDDERLYIEKSLGDSQSKTKLPTPWKEIMTSVPMWALIIVHCGQNWGFWTLLTEIPTFMSKAIGFDMSDNGLISALPYLAMWLLSFPASWLSDYALKRGASPGCIRKVSNSVAHWGPAVALVALTFLGAEDRKFAVALLVVAVGLNAGSICGYQINSIDLSPNFAGTMMSITNCIAAAVAIIAPIINGKIAWDQTNIDQWHTVFYISALIYFVGNLIFVVFGSGEVQWWNEPKNSVG